jgi:hypothetical protein
VKSGQVDRHSGHRACLHGNPCSAGSTCAIPSTALRNAALVLSVQRPPADGSGQIYDIHFLRLRTSASPRSRLMPRPRRHCRSRSSRHDPRRQLALPSTLTAEADEHLRALAGHRAATEFALTRRT